MSTPRPSTSTSSKRVPKVADWMFFVAAYAFDFSWFVSDNTIRVLLSFWTGFVITMAVILLYTPRGWDRVLVAVLIVVTMIAIRVLQF